MDWTRIIELLVTSITSIIIALITAGYFKRKQEKAKEEIAKPFSVAGRKHFAVESGKVGPGSTAFIT